MGNIYVTCARCNKGMTIAEYNCVFCSDIDNQIVCADCFDKEQPKELMKQIADLKNKLAEYEEIKKKYKTIFLDRFVDAKVEDARIWKEKYDQLKQKLAESEKFMKSNGFKTWKEAQEALNGKFECLFDEKHELWKKTVAENAQLKRQLAEKEKIEYTAAIKFVETSEPHIVAEELERLESEILDLEQSQNQTAIDELEKVKDKISYYLLKFDYFTPKQLTQVEKMIKAIDQQIKSLKGDADGSTN